MNDKNFEKINIKFKIRIQQCTPAPNLNQFGEVQLLEPNLSKKHVLWGGVLGQTQPKNNLFQVKSTIMWLVSGSFWVIAGEFRWFQDVPCLVSAVS